MHTPHPEQKRGAKQIKREGPNDCCFNVSTTAEKPPPPPTHFAVVSHTCPHPGEFTPPSPVARKGEDHYLLGVVERDAVTLPCGMLIHHCHACFCMPPRNTRHTEIYMLTQQGWIAQACQP